MGRQDDQAPLSVRQVAAALTGLGAQGRPQPLPADVRTDAEIAAQLGAPVGAVANSVIFMIDSDPLLVLTSGGRRPDPLTLGALLGVGDLRPASAEDVHRWTGQPIDGIAPVAHRVAMQTLVDVELARFPQVWCPAGHPRWVFPSSYAELLRITAGEAAEVGDLAGPGSP